MKDEVVSGLCVGTGCVMTALQTKEVFQIINLVLTAIAFIVSILYTIWKWYRKAKADGKITEDEIDELADSLHDVVSKKNEEE